MLELKFPKTLEPDRLNAALRCIWKHLTGTGFFVLNLSRYNKQDILCTVIFFSKSMLNPSHDCGRYIVMVQYFAKFRKTVYMYLILLISSGVCFDNEYYHSLIYRINYCGIKLYILLKCKR